MTDLQNYLSHLSDFLANRASRRYIIILLMLIGALTVMVGLYSTLFHQLMAREGKEYGWFTGMYWTLTVMSTLGFGDITFTSTGGRMFSMVVLLSGKIFLLILLPCTVIHFIYLPWIETQSAFRAPRKLPSNVNGHVILTHYDPVSSALIAKLTQYNYRHVLLVAEALEASRLADLGLNVVTGYLDDEQTYRNVNVESASMVVMTGSDVSNANLAFIVRRVSSTVPLMATATDSASVDILEFGGIDQVFQLKSMMGVNLARHVRMGTVPARIIGEFEDLVIAEANIATSSLVDESSEEIGLRRNLGLSIVGVWKRGRFEAIPPSTRLDEGATLVLAGSREQIDEFNKRYRTQERSEAPVVVIGGGRVGRSTAKALAEIGVQSRIVEKEGARIKQASNYVVGDAAEREVMEKAGIGDAPSVVITTHDDDTNLYLTMYCRSLCPNIQIVSRSTVGRNVEKMHAAGADFVLSYATMGANVLLSNLERGDTVIIDEGWDVFKVKVPNNLVGKSILESSIPRLTGCTVIAVGTNGELKTNLDPVTPLPQGAEMVLIGSLESEREFLKRYGEA